jgi:hypothetical protein
MATATLNFTDSISGFIQKNSGVGTTYAVGTGYANVAIAKNTLIKPATYKHAFMQFSTVSIPQRAVVSKVELKLVVALALPSPPCTTCGIFFGSWIGSSLDASAADFDGGSDTLLDFFSYGDSVWFDLADSGSYDPTTAFTWGPGGTADVKITHTDVSGTGYAWNTAKSKSQLRVTYTVPPRRLMLGGVGK